MKRYLLLVQNGVFLWNAVFVAFEAVSDAVFIVFEAVCWRISEKQVCYIGFFVDFC